jgi:hypothetical protein
MANSATISRRAALANIGGAGALIVPTAAAMAAPADNSEAQLLALEAEIQQLCALGADIHEKRIEPFEDEFQAILFDGDAGPSNASIAAAFVFSRKCGRCAAADDQAELFKRADGVFARMQAIPAATQSGRAAKVRAFLVHVGELNGAERTTISTGIVSRRGLCSPNLRA